MLKDMLALILSVEKRKYYVPFQDNMQIIVQESSPYFGKVYSQDVKNTFFGDLSYTLSSFCITTALESYC